MEKFTEDQKTKAFERELAFWVFGYISVAIFFLILIVITASIDSPGPLYRYEAFPQFVKVMAVVLLSNIFLVFLAVPICMCFRPLRERRKLIAISVLVLLPISLVLMRLLRLRLLGF